VKARHLTASENKAKELFSELLILADGSVLVHNLTPTFAALLESVDLRDASLAARVPARQAREAGSGLSTERDKKYKTAKYERPD
jgi:hypothetical protein